MDYSAIIGAVDFTSVTTGVVLIFAAFAGVLIAIAGGRFLLNAISGEDGDDDDDFDPDEWDQQMYEDSYDAMERGEADEIQTDYIYRHSKVDEEV